MITLTVSDFEHFGASKEEAPLLLRAFNAWVKKGNTELVRALTEKQQTIVANLYEHLRQSYD